MFSKVVMAFVPLKQHGFEVTNRSKTRKNTLLYSVVLFTIINKRDG